jgi:hypothetical protein
MSGAHLGVPVSVKDCSPRSIGEAIGAISAASRLRRLIRPTPMMAGTATHAVPAIACTNRGSVLVLTGYLELPVGGTLPAGSTAENR